jgi:DMSO/TMAO reductase YedYZ molybdopterin-dependent catalytic subunit
LAEHALGAPVDIAEDVAVRGLDADLRLRVATKLGLKSPKQIVAMEVTNTNPGGY